MNMVVLQSFFRKTGLALCMWTAFQALGVAQVPSEPERNRLLNGLRVVLLPRPGEQDVLIKLRIHSGAAFDLAGKAGSMALLGDLLFSPTPQHLRII